MVTSWYRLFLSQFSTVFKDLTCYRYLTFPRPSLRCQIFKSVIMATGDGDRFFKPFFLFILFLRQNQFGNLFDIWVLAKPGRAF